MISMNPPGRKPVSASQRKQEALHRKEVGRRIKTRIKELGLTYKALGSGLKTTAGKSVSESQVAQWANAHVLPEQWRWQELADALQTTTGHLFGEPEDTSLLKRLERVEAELSAIKRLGGLEEAVVAMLRHQRHRAPGDVLEQIARDAPTPTDGGAGETGQVRGAARRPK